MNFDSLSQHEPFDSATTRVETQEPFTPRVSQLGIAELSAILALQEDVALHLPQGFMRAKTRDQLHAYLDGTQGVAYGIEERGVLVATSLLRLPSAPHPNTGDAFPLVAPEQWRLRAGGLENMMVHPRHRGRGCQRTLLDARLAHAAAAGMHWVCAGVHLHNRASWANLLAAGFAIVGLRWDFGYPLIGLLRGLGADSITTDARDTVLVAAHDPSRHEAALRMGFVGVRCASRDVVAYERLAAPHLHGGPRVIGAA